MPRSLWFAPVALLILAAGALGLRHGWALAHLSEGAVIERYAARYVSDYGAAARPEDCAARPGTGRAIWLVVRCTPRDAGGAVWYEYHVTRLGRIALGGRQQGSHATKREST